MPIDCEKFMNDFVADHEIVTDKPSTSYECGPVGLEPTMTTLELKLNLPDRLAQDAAQMGLLSSDSLQALLREAVRSSRIA